LNTVEYSVAPDGKLKDQKKHKLIQKKEKKEKMEKEIKKTNSFDTTVSSPKISEPSIIMNTKSGGAEVFKFTKDQLFLYGEKIEVNDPEVVQGFKTWLKEWGYINNKKDE
jgi:hypothetical protein